MFAGYSGNGIVKLFGVGKQVFVQVVSMTEGQLSFLRLTHMYSIFTLPRINWTGSALNTFYAAVRKALVVVIVARAIFVLIGLVLGGWFLFFR